MEDMILAHHGVDGQEWGKRKYQYEDGSLTPLGRIHYGVGEARDRAKIKMREEKAKAKNEIRIAKAKAKAEAYKIKAEAKAYKERKNAETRNERERIKAEKELEEQRIKADKEVESKKIEAEREAERDLSKENREISKREAKTQVELAEIANEGKEEKKLSTAGKVALGILATAGVGYLLYKTVSGKGDVKGVSESAKTKAQDIVNNNKDTSAKDLIDKTKEKSKKIADEYYFTPDGKYVRAESRGNKISDFLFGKVNHITTARSEANKKTQAKMQKEYAKAEKQRAEVKAAKKEAQKGQWKVTSQNVKNAWDKLLKRSNMKHSENEGMILIHSEDICHWGILGMKWGVRRYQNPDGTLTELGKQHYGKKDVNKFEKAKGYSNRYKIANESEMVKYFKKNSDEYSDLNKHYEELKALGENVTEQQAKDFQEVTKGVKQAAIDFIEQYSDKPAGLMVSYAWDNENTHAYEIRKQSKIKADREAMENLKKEDLFDEQRVKEDPKRANEAAIIGLKALNKVGRDGYDENVGITKGDKEWFVWEDQTIGLATIADLVNQGKTSSEIKAIVKAANSISDDETTSKQSGVWQLANSGYSWRPKAIDDFIDACIEVKKEESKK